MKTKIRKITISEGRNYLNSKRLTHIVWDENNPDDLRQKWMVIHHIDENPLNDDISNLQLMTKAEHMRLHRTGKINSKETREKISDGNKGKKLSEETLKKMSEFMKGNTYRLGQKATEETRKKLSEIHKGRIFTEEHRKNLSLSSKHNKSFLGKTHSEETKKKLSELKMGNNYNIGRIHTEQSRKNVSEAVKKWWAEKKAGIR